MAETMPPIDYPQTLQLIPTIIPENATYKGVIYTSQNPAVASVTQSGLVTAHGLGVTNITVTSDHYPSITATCRIEVVPSTHN
jgi:uncharacterized protein YjdB